VHVPYRWDYFHEHCDTGSLRRNATIYVSPATVGITLITGHQHRTPILSLYVYDVVLSCLAADMVGHINPDR